MSNKTMEQVDDGLAELATASGCGCCFSDTQWENAKTDIRQAVTDLTDRHEQAKMFIRQLLDMVLLSDEAFEDDVIANSHIISDAELFLRND